MSQYTTQVRKILENAYMHDHNLDHQWEMPFIKPRELCKTEYQVIFDFDFPLLASMTKQDLCTAILMHYYTREIGLETVELWKQFLDTRLNEIMPYYVQLESAKISLADALINRNVTEKLKRDGTENNDTSRKNNGSEESNGSFSSDNDSTSSNNATGSSTVNGTGDSSSNSTEDTTQNIESNGKNLFSETPQDGLEAVINGTYLTTATITNDNETTGRNTEGSQTVHNESEEKQTDSNESSGSTHNENSGTNKNDKTTSFLEDILHNKDYLENVSRETLGFEGDKLDVLLKYRDSILQIPRMIINDLADLFITIL